MQGSGVLVFRDALNDLLESLEASMRLAAVPQDDAAEPARVLASKLHLRFATAERLARGRFNGNRADAQRVASLCGAITKVQGAYVAYVGRANRSGIAPDATAALASAMETARTELAEAQLAKMR